VAKRVIIHQDSYHDSVFLMSLTQRLLSRVSLEDAVVAMAAPHNKALLAKQGYQDAALEEAGPGDLVIAVCGEATVVDSIEDAIDALLKDEAKADALEEARPTTLDAALKALPEANLALISLPGEHAGRAARRALLRGRHVMLFSDNVALEDEIALKELAVERGLLCMGPDCGTAMIAGKPLGFANSVRPGVIGVVGASGTGIQEVTSCIHRLGAGCSQILGTGGRDLSLEVGGRMALFSIEALAADETTSVIVAISKPPAPEVATKVVAALREAGKPAVVHFMGEPPRETVGNVRFAKTLADTAELACKLAGYGEHEAPTHDAALVETLVAKLGSEGPTHKPQLLGLFCGGTTAYEALFLLQDAGLQLESNLKLHGTPKKGKAKGTQTGEQEGLLLDLGADQYTQGRPHPMIEPLLRNEQLEELVSRDAPTLLLFDVVLGFGSHEDPAGVLAAGVSSIARDGLVAIASITGTADDGQGYAASRQRLEAVGVTVVDDNRRAAQLAAAVIQRSAR